MSFQFYLVAALFLLMGLAAFARPRSFVAPLGLPAESADSRNEVQAVYGGFGLAMAALLMAPLWMPDARTGVIVAVAAALGGMAFDRIVGALREMPGKLPWIFFAIEAAGAALILSAL